MTKASSDLRQSISAVVAWIDADEDETREIAALAPPFCFTLRFTLCSIHIVYFLAETKEPITVQEMDYKSLLQNVFLVSVIDCWES
jgi:hypothetical protein